MSERNAIHASAGSSQRYDDPKSWLWSLRGCLEICLHDWLGLLILEVPYPKTSENLDVNRKPLRTRLFSDGSLFGLLLYKRPRLINGL